MDERYDYTANGNNADDVLTEVERLNVKERLKLTEAMKQIKEDYVTEAAAKHMDWFDNTILPALKEYAELTSSLLDIERDRKEVIQATLRNSCGIEFSSDCRCLYMALIMAVQVIIDVEDKDPILVLTYDCRRFIV